MTLTLVLTIVAAYIVAGVAVTMVVERLNERRLEPMSFIILVAMWGIMVPRQLYHAFSSKRQTD